MSQYICVAPQGDGEVEIDPTPLGRGGEGAVHSINNHTADFLPEPSSLVAKLYHTPNEGNRLKKLKAMVSNPPNTTSVAWPLAILLKNDKTFAGYLMIKLDYKSYRPWAELAHSQQRRKTSTNFDVRYGLVAIRNLASALHSIHIAGHRVGDINESNIFVSNNSKILIVDTDSSQIQDSEVGFYPCFVGKPEYTAPELSHGKLSEHERTIESDVFAFSVASYQMLTGGAHPADAIYEGADEPPTTIEKIRQEIYPGLGNSKNGFRHPERIPVNGIPASVKNLIKSSLSKSPQSRPNLESWIKELDIVIQNLKQCPKIKHHWFDERDGTCQWCTHANNGNLDPWSDKSSKDQKVAPTQIELPEIGFNEEDNTPVIKRAAPKRAGAGFSSPLGNQYSIPLQYPQQPPIASSGGTPSAAPQTPSLPTKYKGKSILTYPDGTREVRPPIATLIRHNPKLAISCIKDETPDMAKFWWPANRNIAKAYNIGMGMVLSLLLSLLWFMTISEIFIPITPSWTHYLWQLGAVVAAIGTIFFSGFLATSALLDIKRTKKKHGSIDQFKTESFTRTLIRFLGLSFIYGPLLVLALIGGAIMAAFSFIASLVSSNSTRR